MSELDDIASLAIQKTMAGRLTWQFDGRNTITTKINNIIVEISEVDPNNVHVLRIRNENGVMLSTQTFLSGQGIAAVFSKIKREALGVDQALDQVKKYLNLL